MTACSIINVTFHPEPLILLLQTGDLRSLVRRRQHRLLCGEPRRCRRLAPSPTSLDPATQYRITQAKFLGHRADRPAARSHQIDRLPLIIIRKRPTFISLHSTPLGSASLLQVSINSEEAQESCLSDADEPTRGWISET